MQILFFYKLNHLTTLDNNQLEDFYELIKPIYEILNISLQADTLTIFIEYLDLCSNRREPMNIIRYRRRALMLALHCLCLLLRCTKQQQLDANIRSKISICFRPILFDYILKVTQFCNQLYDRQINPFYDILKINLTYSDTERQLYLGTYESNNVTKATIPSTVTPSSPPVSYVRLNSTSNILIDDERLRDYLHRLFDICYQINGMYFAHDTDLYYLKLNDNNYLLTTYLQKILFENFNTLPSFRLRIVLRHFCRLFVENYSSSINTDKEIIDELFLKFLNAFLPYIQQRLTTMWNNLLTTTMNYQQGQCSDEVIEECVCVLITRDFIDIIRYFIFKTISGQTNSSSINMNKKKNKINLARNNSESMCEETNGDLDQIDEWDEQTTYNNISNKLLNNSHEKLDYSDLFMYMMKMARQNSSLALHLFSNIIRILFECLTFPDAYCINRFLPIILPITKFYTDVIDKQVNISSLIDIKFLFQCLLKSLDTHNENESVNTNLISLIARLLTNNDMNNNNNNNNTKKSPQQPITERERRDTFKNLLNPILLSPMSSRTRALNSTNPFNI
ncbi:unnamed protein product [Rotaria sp. Silwood1]|nr:unnamed protein product [Rotaria sp. Silwood1]